MVVAVEAGLVIGFTGISQRVIHVNVHLALFSCFRPVNDHTTGKIFGDVRATIEVMAELQQLDGKRLVMALRAQSKLISSTIEGERLRPPNPFTTHPLAPPPSCIPN